MEEKEEALSMIVVSSCNVRMAGMKPRGMLRVGR
jgi:hypothetical protein